MKKKIILIISFILSYFFNKYNQLKAGTHKDLHSFSLLIEKTIGMPKGLPDTLF